MREVCSSSEAVHCDDLRDIRGSVAGDGEAYARLVRRHQQAIARHLWRFTRDPAACEELAQEVFVQAYFSLRSFRGRSPFDHWLTRIATRVGYRYWKDRRHERLGRAISPPIDAAVARPDPPTSSREAGEQLHAVLARLPPRDRLVLTLMYLEGRSVAQVADLVGWTKTMVKVQAHRARGKLKKLLERQERSR